MNLLENAQLDWQEQVIVFRRQLLYESLLPTIREGGGGAVIQPLTLDEYTW